jgi:outer membrane protein TolC
VKARGSALLLCVLLGSALHGGAAASEAALSLAEAKATAVGRSALVAAEGERAAALSIGRATTADGLELRLSESDLTGDGTPRAQAALRLRWKGLAVGMAERGVEDAVAAEATASQRALAAEIEWSVERSFATILLLEAELARRQEAEQAWAAVAAGVSRRAELGVDTALDVVSSKIKAVEAAGRARTAAATLAAEQASLRSTLGLAPAAPLQLDGPPPAPRAAPAADDRAAAAEAQVMSAEASIARARTLPRLDFVQAGVEGGPTPGAQVSLAVRLPLLDGSIGESREQRALAAAASAAASAVAAQVASEQAAQSLGLEAALGAIRAQAQALAEARAALPAVTGVEPLAQAELRAKLAELEAGLLADERGLWP